MYIFSMLQIYFWKTAVINISFSFIVSLCTLMGMSLGINSVLRFELGKAINSELPPEISGGINFALFNIFCALFLVVPAGIMRKWMNLLFTMCVAVSIFVELYVILTSTDKQGFHKFEDQEGPLVLNEEEQR
eukprot:UN17092